MSQEKILTALGVVALVAILGAVAAFAMGGDDGPSVSVANGSTTSSSAVAAPVPSTSSTSTSSTSTTAPANATGAVCSVAEEAPKAFVAGWIAGDRAAAGRCASATAVDTIFQTSGTGAQYTFQGCDYTDPGVPICSYTYPGGSARLTIEGTEAGGWKVTKVEYTAD